MAQLYVFNITLLRRNPVITLINFSFWRSLLRRTWKLAAMDQILALATEEVKKMAGTVDEPVRRRTIDTL
jgi:hypothetical protein